MKTKNILLVAVLAACSISVHAADSSTPDILSGLTEHHKLLNKDEKAGIRGTAFSSRAKRDTFCRNNSGKCDSTWSAPKDIYFYGKYIKTVTLYYAKDKRWYWTDKTRSY